MSCALRATLITTCVSRFFIHLKFQVSISRLAFQNELYLVRLRDRTSQLAFISLFTPIAQRWIQGSVPRAVAIEKRD